MTRNQMKGIVAIIASAFGFAVMAACVRLCDNFGAPVGCFEKSFFRNVAALVIASFPLLQKGLRREVEQSVGRGRNGWKVGRMLLIRSVLGTTGIFANFYALSHIPIADGQTLNKTAPFWTVIFAWWFLKERGRFWQIAAVVVAFLGAVLVVKPGFAGENSFALMMGLLGGVCAGGAYTAVRALGAMRVDSAMIVFFFSAFSCIASIPFMVCDFVPLSWAQVAVLIGAGLGAALGQFGITIAYRFAAPREIAVFDYSNIIWAAGLGYCLFGQVSDVYSIVGMGVIVVAAWLQRRG